MSNKVYFSGKNTRKSPVWPLVRSVSWVMHYILPDWTARKTSDLLLTPQCKKLDLTDIPPGFVLSKIDSEDGQLQCYETGDGPIVLLTHGWAGGAYQFFPLMQKISESGYKAVAFDHPAHGHSDGKYASAPQFIQALQSTIDFYGNNGPEKISGIVAHSMGCVAAANIDSGLFKNIPMCLIAPAFELQQNMIDKICGFGLFPKLFHDLLAKVEKQYDVNIDKIELNASLPSLSPNILILHDKQDKFVDPNHSIKFCSDYPEATLFLTEGLGHGRIINDDSSWEKIQQHLCPSIEPQSQRELIH